MTADPIRPLAAVVRDHIEAVLRECDGNKTKAARLLQITRTTLRAKLKASQPTGGSHAAHCTQCGSRVNQPAALGDNKS